MAPLIYKTRWDSKPPPDDDGDAWRKRVMDEAIRILVSPSEKRSRSTSTKSNDRVVREAVERVERAADLAVIRGRRNREKDEAARLRMNLDLHQRQARMPDPKNHYKLLPPKA